MNDLSQVAQRILNMQGPAQVQAINKMRAAGMKAWSFPIPAGRCEPRCAKLTPSQQEMFATQVADPTDPRFHLYGAYELNGPVDLEGLRLAMAALVQRHGALRTRFVQTSQGPVQEMLPADAIDLRDQVSWSQEHAPQDRSAWLQRQVVAPFSLEQGGLWRVRLCRHGSGVVVLAMFHHLIMDAWSMAQLVRELGLVLGSSGTPSLPAATHFVDYAAWRTLWTSDQDEKAPDFWRNYLQKAKWGWRRTSLAQGRRWGQGQKVSQSWSPALSAALHQSAQRLETTPFLLLLTGFYSLLDRLEPSAPWVVASTVADRPCVSVESSLGYFVKTVLTKSPDGEHWSQRLSKLQADWAEIQTQSSLPLGRILKALRADDAAADLHPAILFVLHNTPKVSSQSQGWRALSTGRAFARFPLSLRVDATAYAPVRVSCEYDRERFVAEDIEALMAAFQGQLAQWLLPEQASSVELPQGVASALRELADRGEDNVVGEAIKELPRAGTSLIEGKLAEIWSAVLGIAQVRPNDNFFALGGDSISSLQVVSRALRQGWRIKAQDLAQAPSLSALAVRVQDATLAKLGPRELRWTCNPRLSAAQRWFFGLKLRRPEYFNQSQLLVTRPGVDMKTLVTTLSQLVLCHEALRMRFVYEAQRWQAKPCELSADTLIDFVTQRLELVDQSKQSSAEAAQEIFERSVEAMQGHELDRGGLFRVQFFDRGFGQPGRLLVVLHHLIVDGVSWRLLLSQWDELVADLEKEAPSLVQHPSPFALEEMPDLLPDGQAPALVAEPEANGPVALAQCTCTLALSGMTESTVQGRSHALLDAWVQSVAGQQQASRVVVDIESHGRDNEQHALCVGWMTQRQSLVFDTPSDSSTNRVVIRQAQQDPCLFEQVSLCFNDHGQARVDLDDAEGAGSRGLWARPLTVGQERVAPARAPEDRRPYAWTLNCYHRQDALHIHWLYDPRLHQASTIEAMLNAMKETLQSCSPAVSESQSPEFPGMQDEELQSILEALNP